MERVARAPDSRGEICRCGEHISASSALLLELDKTSEKSENPHLTFKPPASAGSQTKDIGKKLL
ncbi:MAG: hypothetical protein LUD39_01645 [Opitutae bacterium]|nr:hypothetical protein [Opitutae bacterium]MCD8298450.1 hypothetical protein [Opitutae bacterium]